MRAKWLSVVVILEFAAIVLLAAILATRPDEERAAGSAPERPPVRVVNGSAAEPRPTAGAESTSVPASSPRSAPPTRPTRESSGELDSFVVHGTVTDAEGNAVRHASGRFIPEDGDASGAPIAFAVRDRAYSVAGLAPGRYTVRCSAPEHLESSESIELAGPAALRRIDIVLERAASIAIRFVTPDGQTLAAALGAADLSDGLSAIATRNRQSPLRRPVGTDHVGSFARAGESLDGDGPHGVLHLAADPPLHVSVVWNTIVVATEFVPELVRELTLVVPLETFFATRGSIRFRVVDGGTGAPMADVLAAGDFGLPIVTGADGRVELEGVAFGFHSIHLAPPGSYQLLEGGGSVSRQGPAGTFMPRQVACELEPGQALDLGDVALRVSTFFRGVVRGEAESGGKPVGASFLLAPRGALTGPGGYRHLDRSHPARGERFHSRKEDGGFEAVVAPGSYCVIPEGNDTVRFARPVEVPPAGLDGFEISVPAGVAVRLRPAPALLAKRPGLFVEDAAGIPVYYTDDLEVGARRFRLVLPPGPHVARVVAGETVLATESFAVGPDPMDLPLE